MASRGGAVAAAAGQARKRADSFRSTGSMEVGDSGEIDHSGPTMNPRRVLPNAKGRDKLQKSLKEHGKYTQREIRAIEKMQYRFRCRRTNRRLYKKNLIERLEYERRFTFGFLGLFNQTAIFFLLIASLYLGGQEDMQRGIYFALNEAFDFDAIKTVSSRDEFMTEMMPHIATTSKKYFVLSSQYFDTKDKGALELLKPVTHFAVPRLLNGVQVNLNLPSFSWTCWVKMSSFSRSGAHVVRKRIETKGSSQEQWCWALSLDKINGPTFQYAAHDHFDTSIDILKAEYSPPTGITLKAKRKQIGSTSSAKARKIVDGTYTSHTSHTTHGWDDFRFLTMTANRTHASFFMDAQLLETIRLPRVITDCYSAEGLRIGDAGLHLGKLIFYPSELTPEQIAEIHHGGSTLVDFASGSDPADAEIAPTTFSKNVFDATDYPKQLRLNAAGPAQAAQKHRYRMARSPPAPHGDMLVNPAMRQDSSGGSYYTTLVQGPVRLTKPDLNAGEEPRMLVGVPTFINSGMTLTTWYRHVDCGPGDSCGVYLLWAQGMGGGSNAKCNSLIWSLWLESDGIYFDNPSGTPKYQYPRNFMGPRAKWRGEHVWRHIAFSLDETTDQALLYMDGQLAVKVPWGSSVEQADCPNRKVALGHGLPGWTYGAQAEVFDMRMYVHAHTGAAKSGPISAREIYSLAHQATAQITPAVLSLHPQPGEGLRCIDRTDPAHVDKVFSDSFGNDCEWYHTISESHPAICSLPEPQANCRLTCSLTHECYSPDRLPKAYFVWDRIRRLEPRTGVNGTFCLGRQNRHEGSALEHKNSVVQSCKEWADRQVRPEDIEPWASSAWGNSQIRRVNVADCLELADAIDADCSFDSEPVASFTSDAIANGGDFTITFWVRPLRLPDPTSSMHTDGKFHPSIHFMASLSPPVPVMGLGLWANPDGEVRMYSTCPTAHPDGSLYKNIEIFAPTSDDWTFIAITRVNSTWPQTTYKVFTNLGKFEEQSNSATCLADESQMFKAIEVNYPMLVTPVMMVPEALSDSDVQTIFLRGATPLRVRDGPLESHSLDPTALALDSLPVYKLDFRERSVLMAPPLIIQERHAQSAECPFRYSTQWLREQHKVVRTSICAPPNTCVDPDVMTKPELIMACRGKDIKKAESFFGLKNAFKVDGKHVYAEFLYTLTDHDLVFRAGEVKHTNWFIDSGTANARVIFCFYTPDAGVVSVLTVSADFSTHMPVKMRLWLQHYGMVVDKPLYLYVFVQSLCLINIGIMIVSLVVKFVQIVRQEEAMHLKLPLFVVSSVLDLFTALAALLFVALRIPAHVDSERAVSGVLSRLAAVPWGDDSIPVLDKNEMFFEVVDQLLVLIERQKFLTMLCLLILFICLMRIIASMNCHPRLALLTQTLAKARDDLWHAVLLIVTLMAAFACIGTWRFGEEFVHFSSMRQSFLTEFSMLFGDFPDEWTRSTEMTLFVTTYFLILFLCVQNFLLAIIVAAYTKVREFNESFQSEEEFFTDCWNSGLAYCKRYKYGWPRRDLLALHLKEFYGSRVTVGFKELAEIRAPTASFQSHHAIHTFLEHYKRFAFLEPPEPGLYGHKRGYGAAMQDEDCSDVNDLGDAIHEIERRIAHLLGKPLKMVVDYKLEAMRREVLGVAWMDIGPEEPSSGKEILNASLAAELQYRTRFTKKELEQFKSPLLSTKSFIKVGDKYFRPVGALEMTEDGANVTLAARCAGNPGVELALKAFSDTVSDAHTQEDHAKADLAPLLGDFGKRVPEH